MKYGIISTLPFSDITSNQLSNELGNITNYFGSCPHWWLIVLT